MKAQQETHLDVNFNKKENFLEIFQLNWQSIKLSINPIENSQMVLKRYAQAVHLDDHSLPYFCLYLVRRIGNDYRVVRRLQNFESPYLTLLTENKRNSGSSLNGAINSIIVRKSYWDCGYDEDLYQNKAALNIIYWQALHEIEKSYVLANKDIRSRLTTLQAMGDKIEV